MYTLLIDNHDSFTYNIYHLLRGVDALCEVRIVEVEEVRRSDVLAARRVVLSAGSGLPTQSTCLLESIGWVRADCPLLGICLGHQAIALYYGGSLLQLARPCHGEQSRLLIGAASPLFAHITGTTVARYHSWVVDSDAFPAQLQVTSLSEDGCIMSFQHRTLPRWGVQFHPESFVTTAGEQMMGNFFKL